MFVPVRLAKFVRESTCLSAAEADRACRNGRVSSSSGEVAPDGLVFSEDEILLDGRRLELRELHVTAALNKPRSVTCTVHDPTGKRDLRPWLDQMPLGMFPVGRLDRDTTGLLLFTTDGDLASALTRPEHHADRLYWLWLNETLDDQDDRLKRFTSGIHMQGHLARAASVRVWSRSTDYSELLVVLREGRNRQLRRMCRALDLRLLHIHRKAIGGINDAELALGNWRPLDEHEVDKLWQAAGGRQRVRARRIAALQRFADERRRVGHAHQRLEAWLERLEAPPPDQAESGGGVSSRPSA